MYDLMIYSLKVGVCLAVFYLFFKLLLSAVEAEFERRQLSSTSFSNCC